MMIAEVGGFNDFMFLFFAGLFTSVSKDYLNGQLIQKLHKLG